MTACTFCGGTGTVTNAASWVAGVANAREDATCPRCGGTGKGPVNSRRKGSRGEREFIDLHLSPYWPEAGRNLDQFGQDKRDVIRAGGVHWQVKRVERLNIWVALAQAEREAIGDDLPVVAFRRSHGGWYCALAADALVALLAWKETDD